MSPDEVSAALGGAMAPYSYNLGNGVGWGYYPTVGVTAIYGDDSGLVGISVRAAGGPQVVLRGVELIGKTPSALRLTLESLALQDGAAFGVNWSGDPEVPAWGISMGATRHKDALVTDALLVSAELASAPYQSESIVQWRDVSELAPDPGFWLLTTDRERPHWTWAPLEKVGPLQFGMTPQQVAIALNGLEPTARTGRHPHGAPWEGEGPWTLHTERFEDAGVTTHYTYRDGHPCLGAVHVHGLNGPQIELSDIRLIGMAPSVVESAMMQYCNDRNIDLVESVSGLGPDGLGLYVGTTRAGDVVVTDGKFCASDWYDEG
ncbi:hypothetical protein ACFQLX_14170 [Streptomyces polyrhachis]|uniref:Uncharacterized protein n=1 Tax=Streptomyces polyrhachis TaxID=1282885 RepID=A0ABW2GF24_9ACTN